MNNILGSPKLRTSNFCVKCKGEHFNEELEFYDPNTQYSFRLTLCIICRAKLAREIIKDD